MAIFTTLTRKVREVCVADFDEAVIYCRELKVTYIYFFFSANTHIEGVKTTFKIYPQILFFRISPFLHNISC